MNGPKNDVFIGENLLDPSDPFWVKIKHITDEEAAFLQKICVQRGFDVLIREADEDCEGG